MNSQPPSNRLQRCRLSPDGEMIVTGSDDGFVRIWNVSTHINLRSANAGTDVNGVAWSADGQYVAAAINDDTINIYYASNLSSVHGSLSCRCWR